MRVLSLLVFAVLAACAPADRPLVAGEGRLPAPVANNAVAHGKDAEGRGTVYSFLGLGAGKTHADIVRAAYACVEATLECRALPDVPTTEGRLASVAASVGGKIYLFGGYTVAADGAEKSTPEVFRFDPAAETYARVADMPTPVDDSTAIVLFDRYVYFVSGWHDTANVALVQVYDAAEDRWFSATDFPGAPVFGQAGGAGSGGRLLVAGGVKLTVGADGKRSFSASDEVWVGTVADASRPDAIAWRRAPAPPIGPFYRMGASVSSGERILIAGGGDNPYNYNGVGYDGTPARPVGRLLAFDLDTDRWLDLGPIPASMDHRGLVAGEDGFYLVGGLGEGGAALDRVLKIDRRAALTNRGVSEE